MTDRVTKGRLARLHAAYRDLEEAKRYCELSRRFAPEHAELHQPLLIAIVVTYCKPFTGAGIRKGKVWESTWGDGHPRPILDGSVFPALPDAPGILDDAEEKAAEGASVGMFGLKRGWRTMHAKMLGTLRHMHYAHSDGTARAGYLDNENADEVLETETLLAEDIQVIADMCEAAMAAVMANIEQVQDGHLECLVPGCKDCGGS